jgi:polyisoprenoid-binding protein YceI
MVPVVAAGALVLMVPHGAHAAEANPAAVAAGAYSVDPDHTRVVFSVNHLGFNDYFGEFSGITGSLSLNPKSVETSHLDVTIPVTKLSTTNPKLDGELLSNAWFDAATYPTIHFVSTKVTRTGDRTAEVAGELTMHGVTKPAVLEVTFKGAGPNPMTKAMTSGFSIRGAVKRSDFGISTYLPLIGDDIDLTISAAFEKKPG